MIIELKKFGLTLVSRPAGKEAWLAFQPILNNVQKDEQITVDFKDVVVLTPSWADEFITPLRTNFKNKIIFINSDNPSVKATMEILDKNAL